MASRNNETCAAAAADVDTIEMVGSPCGQHAAYTFYKAFKYLWRGQSGIIAVGDFFLLKPWTDQDIISIGELQLAWLDKTTGQALASLKLYFLPENTPDGRMEFHGEDEVLSISEKVVMRISDLVSWLAADIQWDKGTRGFRRIRSDLSSDWSVQSSGSNPIGPAANGDVIDVDIPTGCGFNGLIDMRDVLYEKELLRNKGHQDHVTSSVMVLGYPVYCRFRAALKRFEKCEDRYLGQALVSALGGRACPGTNTRVFFCKDTFDYPELEDHELLCNHLAPKWKARPRRKRKKRSHSPGSESNESESSVSTVTSSIKSKDSPGKNGLQLGLGKRSRGEEVFLQKLHKFMSNRGTPIGRLPSLGFKQLDLFQFYNKVQRAGGYDAAVSKKMWKGIYIELGGHPSNTSAATCTRKHYEKLLLPFEQNLDQDQDEGSHDNSPSSKKQKLANPLAKRANSEPPHSPAGDLTHDDKEHSKSVSPCVKDSSGEPHIVESSLSPIQVASPKKDNSPPEVENSPPESENSPSEAQQPMIVESVLPVQDSANPSPPPPLPQRPMGERDSSSYLFQPIRESLPANEDPEIIVLSPKATPPKITIRTDLTAEEEGAKVEKKPNLTLQELMTVANPMISGESHSALSDLARIANQLQGDSKSIDTKFIDKKSIENDSVIKQLKFNSGDSVQITLVNKTADKMAETKKGRVSVIQAPPLKKEPANQQPEPAHSQKPFMADQSKDTQKSLIQNKKSGLVSSNDCPLPIGWDLARPPTPIASTPSMFVATNRIFGDPVLDVRRSNRTNPLRCSQIPVAHSSAAKTEPRPLSPPLPVKAASSLVNLTYRERSLPETDQWKPSSSIPETNGKCLLDLSINHENLVSSTPNSSSSTTIKLHPWSATNPGGGVGKSGVLTVAGDVSISVNVKIEGNANNNEAKNAAAGQSSRHSVTVMPVVKDETGRGERERLRLGPNVPQLRDRVSVTPHHGVYAPKMVDSLMSNQGTSLNSQSKLSYGPFPSHSQNAVPPSVSVTSSSLPLPSSSSSSSVKPPETTLNPLYSPFIDPNLAAYYSMYAPHLYGLPTSPFLPPLHGLPPGPSAAEVTAQVYKDLVQRGYPPALAPGLPVPPLGSLGTIGNLSSIPGLSLGAMSSLYQQMSGRKESSGNERSSLPKS